MSYDARVFTVLVASPGDVQEERQEIAKIIHEWNNLNSRDRSIVLLPLRWETHAHPEMGAEPQVIINRQIVNECDMAVGVFWTRLGTPTSTAESGSAEEISRVGESGKPVMMYFSNAPVPPGDLDLKELARLRDYQAQNYPQGLIEQYSSIQEFRDKFTRQLSAKVMEIAANDAKRQSAEAETAGDVLEGNELLTLSVAGEPDKQTLENPVILRKLICTDREKIPDYAASKKSNELRVGSFDMSAGDSPGLILREEPNLNYYRRLVEYIENMSTETSFSFGLEASHSAVRDVHAQMRMTTDGSVLISTSPAYTPPSKAKGAFSIAYSGSAVGMPSHIELSRISRGEWDLNFDIPVVQVGRQVYSPPLYMYPTGNSTLRCEATIYSSESKPFLLSHVIELQVQPAEEKYVDILKRFG
ncbi:hypothetical protein [Streptomyces microflavus]|uniref:hypothetical protein n=1 Tax=Streptomyces microflavus TaxID=1919 RepID=UPI002E36E44A|nr:hypothetical protein [Streptomyces microflavus]